MMDVVGVGKGTELRKRLHVWEAISHSSGHGWLLHPGVFPLDSARSFHICSELVSCHEQLSKIPFVLGLGLLNICEFAKGGWARKMMLVENPGLPSPSLPHHSGSFPC